jgi:hypothetical protein
MRTSRPRALGLFAIVTIAAASIATPAFAVPNTIRPSVSSNGTQANGPSTFSAVSQDGRYVAFDSTATNIGLDTNAASDVFVHDRKTGKTRRVSVRSNGLQGNGASQVPDISNSGRFVTFLSGASNLVAGDTNGTLDVFVHDRKTGKTTRVSTRSNGDQANGSSLYPKISADGRFVAFESSATNLVPGDGNGVSDVFVKDRKTGKTRRVSVRSNGAQGNNVSLYSDISPNGRYVTFTSVATNLVNGDTNAQIDVFLHDRKNGKTKRSSVGPAGEGNGGSLLSTVSNNGLVAFASQATNFVGGDTNAAYDIFVRNASANNIRRVSISTAGAQGNGQSPTTWRPEISGSGRYVAFESSSTNLVANDTNGTGDVFVRDRNQNKTRRVSVRFDGSQATGGSSSIADVTDNGRFIVFTSLATNIVVGDSNATSDIFLRSTS